MLTGNKSTAPTNRSDILLTEYSVLARSELINEQRASLRVLPAVKAVQLLRHRVKLLIAEVKLGQ